MSRVRCTASGQQRSWTDEAWINVDDRPVQCPDCGAVGDFRATMDRPPFAKVRAHTAPAGVVPGPYVVLSSAGRIAPAEASHV